MSQCRDDTLSAPGRRPSRGGTGAARLETAHHRGAYGEIRGSSYPRGAWSSWVSTRSELFRRHPQSPIPEARGSYDGPYVYPYDEAWRALAEVGPAEPKRIEIPTSTGEGMVLRRWGVAHFRLQHTDFSLELYWLEGYGGGVFAPFADATSGHDTYGAGRYLLDSIKGADLGERGWTPGIGLQLRLSAILLVRPAVDVSAGAAGEPTFALPVRAGERLGDSG